mmetsp:Transcript_29620/g.45777  ORF Transcript_29620/g.45777 Transcript_29620/m.45777 type:complete len:92 (-) Transcript_29620:161-436(-)
MVFSDEEIALDICYIDEEDNKNKNKAPDSLEPSFSRCAGCNKPHIPERFWKLAPGDEILRIEWENLIIQQVQSKVTLKPNDKICDKYFFSS